MIGENTHGFEMTDLVMRVMDTPPDFLECVDIQEKRESTQRSQMAILQKFSIRVIVYPNRVEIKGAIPTQILDKTNKVEDGTTPMITSAWAFGALSQG